MSIRISPGFLGYWQGPFRAGLIDRGIGINGLIAASFPPREVDMEPILGFKLEFEPKELVDCIIIAIHGVAGHPIWSWTTPYNRTCWLRDMLPKTLPTARVYTYGWALADGVGNRGKTMSDHAQDFLNQLQKDVLLKYKNVRIPLLFICHNLGGAILAEATILAPRIGMNWLLDIGIVRGVLFLGTPFHGIVSKRYMKIAFVYHQGDLWSSSIVRQFDQVFKYIVPKPAVLATLRAQYARVAPWRVYQFCDDGRNRLVGKKQCGLGLPPEQEQFIMVKRISCSARFDAMNDEGYVHIINAVHGCLFGEPSPRHRIQSLDNKEGLILRSLHSDPYDKDYENEHDTFYEDTINYLDAKHLEFDGSAESPLPEYTELATTEMDLIHHTKTIQHVTQEHGTTPAPYVFENISNLTDDVAENVITQAGIEPVNLPVGAQAAIAAITSAGVGIAAVNAHSSRVSAKASMRSAEAAELNAKIAERKLLFDMRKELQYSPVSTTDDPDSPPPMIERNVEGSAAEPVQKAFSEARERPLLLGESRNNWKKPRTSNRVISDGHGLTNKERLNVLHIKSQIEKNTAARRLPAQKKRSPESSSRTTVQPDENKLAGKLQMMMSRLSSKGSTIEQVHTSLPSRKGKTKAAAAQTITAEFIENDASDVSLPSEHAPTDSYEDDSELDKRILDIILEDAIDETESRDKPSGSPLSTEVNNGKSPQYDPPMSPASASSSLLEPDGLKMESLDQMSSIFDEVGTFFRKHIKSMSKQQQQEDKADQS